MADKPIRFKIINDGDTRTLVEDDEGDLVAVPVADGNLYDRIDQLTSDMEKLRRAVTRLTHRIEGF